MNRAEIVVNRNKPPSCISHQANFTVKPRIRLTKIHWFKNQFLSFCAEWGARISQLYTATRDERFCKEFFFSEFTLLNPYLLHFGNIQERHLWKKNPKFTFWSLMTSYMTNNLWRHMNLKLHQLGYLYVTWPKSRDVIRVRYHVFYPCITWPVMWLLPPSKAFWGSESEPVRKTQLLNHSLDHLRILVVISGSMSGRGNSFEYERASLLKLNTRKYSKLISDEMIHENNLLIRTDQINLISGQWN